jgi:uncharacterized membrane protein
MSLLLLGLVLFIASHSIGMAPSMKANLKGAMGVKGYRAFYSVFSLIGLVVLVYGFASYRATGWVELWTPPAFLRHLNFLFMLVAFIALAASMTPRGYIKARLKHPMLVGVKAWAFGHLLANGDLGGLILFGGILAWAVVNRISYKWRPGEGIRTGEPRVLGDVLAVVIGLLAYGAMMHFHQTLIGVSVFG